jgi:hypothetical protein
MARAVCDAVGLAAAEAMKDDCSKGYDDGQFETNLFRSPRLHV